MTGIPSTETIWEHIIEYDAEYFVTSKKTRDCYYVYKKEGNKAVKLGKGDTPPLAKKKYIKRERN